VTTKSPADTQSFAADLTRKYINLTRRFPLILALQGDLGVGKTQFVKGIASALGINLTITSPTYTLMKEYPYAQPKYSGMLYHIDTWRLSDPTELESTLVLKDLLKPGNIVAIEWAGKASDLIKSYEKEVPILVINIKEISEHERLIEYAFSTPEWS
jgi:tRNA threonylcarbamoyl adenosine modification protein YjeE